jgi:hypothetical protein
MGERLQSDERKARRLTNDLKEGKRTARRLDVRFSFILYKTSELIFFEI